MGQVEIYVGKCFRMFRNEKGWKVLISAAIITLIISSVTGSDTFVVAQATRNGAFALVCACIWIGIFNSIQSICRERAIIKREHRTGLHISFYIIAHMIFALEGASKVIANFTISKWGVNAICTTANVNNLAQALLTYKDDYDFSQPHLLKMWLILILFTIVYGILSIVVLEFVDKDKR